MKWLFLVGCNNSGTTILDFLLGKHPQIDGLEGEAQHIVHETMPTAYPRGYLLPNPILFFNEEGNNLGRVWTERMDVFRKPIVSVPLLKRVLLNLRRTTEGEFLMEKSPPDSVRTLWLQENFEESWFVGIVRNGYATSEGIRRRKNIRLAWERYKLCEKRGYSDRPALKELDISRAARHWNKTNVTLFEDAEELRNFTWITYEALCEQPEKTLSSIEDFLSIEHFDYTEILSNPISGGTDLVTGKEKKGMLANRNPRAFERLNLHDIDNIRREAKRMLDHFGYVKPR